MINHFLLNAKYHNDDNITSRAIFSKRKRKTLQDTQMKSIIERKKKNAMQHFKDVTANPQ